MSMEKIKILKKLDALAPIEGKILFFFFLKNKRFGMIAGLASKINNIGRDGFVPRND